MKRGFTLIETIIVVAIIAALATVMMGVYPRIEARQKRSVCIVNEEQILEGIERYKEITGQLPQTQQDFESVLLDTHYFEKVPENPYWNDNKNHPEKGWRWDAESFSVMPVMPSQ